MILVALLGAKVPDDHHGMERSSRPPQPNLQLLTLMAGGVFYGGFLAALFFTLWYVRVQKISFWKLADVAAPGVALGQSVGRLGCFSAGCDYASPPRPHGSGITSNFAHEVAGVPLFQRLHPTQLYESFTTFAIFGMLLWWFQRTNGMEYFPWLLGPYAVARFFLEFLRGDEDGLCVSSPVSTSQFIALLALAGIAAVLVGDAFVIARTARRWQWREYPPCSHPAKRRPWADSARQ